jgi:uncharacterized membrane protein
VIVGAFIGEEPNGAFRWTEAEGYTFLGEAGFHDSEATAASYDGSIIVGYASDPWWGPRPGEFATIWDATHGTRLLQDVLVDEYGLGAELEGWTLTTARGISYDGTVIAGYGTNSDGNIEAWVAIIPEPSGSLLISVGLLFSTLFRRRTRQVVRLNHPHIV